MAFKTESDRKSATYYSIKEGTFRLATTKEDPEAVKREYTNPKTKESGVAYERSYKALFGTITNITFHENQLKDGTVLRSINISLGEDDNGITQIVSIPVDSRFTSDFLKRLPKINLDKEVRLMPYDFEPKEGPRQVGLAITQANDDGEFIEKIGNDFFVQMKEDKKGNKTYSALHGFPEPTDEDKSDWPFYFKKVNKFLINYAKTNILTRFSQEETAEATRSTANETKPQHDTGEINPDDIPF